MKFEQNVKQITGCCFRDGTESARVDCFTRCFNSLQLSVYLRNHFPAIRFILVRMENSPSAKLFHINKICGYVIECLSFIFNVYEVICIFIFLNSRPESCGEK